MTTYFSETVLKEEIIDYLRKNFPRGKLSSHYLEITRANTIDYDLLLHYFDCAVGKTHELYEVAITLPIDLEDRIPFWFIQSDGEVWVDPNSGPRGKNINRNSLFVLKFNLYIDEKKVHNLSEARNLSVEKALIGEFDEVRHSLIEGNEEPIELFRGIYGQAGPVLPVKTRAVQHLASILTVPH